MIRFASILACVASLAACAETPPVPATPPPSPSSAASPSAVPAASSSARPSAGNVVKVGDADDGKTVNAKVGDTVELTLTTNPTTGYDWQVQLVDRSLGAPTVRRPAGPGPADGIGAATTVTFVWSLSHVEAGDHKIELGYRRPWEKDGPPEKAFRFTLHVAS